MRKKHCIYKYRNKIKPKGYKTMKIIHLNESGTMKFKKAPNYYENTSSHAEALPESSSLFILSEEGTFALEITLHDLSNILRDNVCVTPVLIDNYQSKLFEELKRIRLTQQTYYMIHRLCIDILIEIRNSQQKILFPDIS